MLRKWQKWFSEEAIQTQRVVHHTTQEYNGIQAESEVENNLNFFFFILTANV